jgi:ParB family transcriptional regulator, chromosome partitioning protein
VELGMKEIPASWVKRADTLTAEERRRFIVMDNVGFGAWDFDILAADFDLPDMKDWGVDLDKMEIGLGRFSADETAAPDLKDGDRAPFRQATFTLHDEQWEEVEAALKKAKADGGGESAVNENSNGNALAWICWRFNRG